MFPATSEAASAFASLDNLRVPVFYLVAISA